LIYWKRYLNSNDE
jgi:hypothetical protein